MNRPLEHGLTEHGDFDLVHGGSERADDGDDVGSGVLGRRVGDHQPVILSDLRSVR